MKKQTKSNWKKLAAFTALVAASVIQSGCISTAGGRAGFRMNGDPFGGMNFSPSVHGSGSGRSGNTSQYWNLNGIDLSGGVFHDF